MHLRRHVIAAALGLSLAALASPVAARPADYSKVLADPARVDKNRALDEGRLPAEMLDFAGVKRGDVVADYQAGGGYYTELLSRVVGPRGRVYAMTQPNFYEKPYWDTLVASHPNVMPVVAPGQALTLAPRSVDVLFTHLVYHDLYWQSDKYQHPRMDVPQVLKGWFAAVRPGGHVIVIDHAANPGEVRATVDKLHRIDPDQVKADMAAAGFVLAAESGLLRRSTDTHESNVFAPEVRGKTDRFALKFRRP